MEHDPLHGQRGTAVDARRFTEPDMWSGPDAAEAWLLLAPRLAATPWARRSPDGGDNFPDGRRLRFRVEDVPDEPSTISIYTAAADGATTGRLLVGDFDVSKAEVAGAADPAALVAAEAATFAELIEQCGGRVVHDMSPSGGRHVYLKLARAVPFEELRDVAVALADRFTTLDPAPMLSRSGQIRIAGSPYKREPVEQPNGTFRRTGRLIGYMALTMPWDQAAAALRRPCGPRVWGRLQEQLAAERAAVDPAPSLSAPIPGLWHLDGQGRPFVPRPGGRRPLPLRLAELATTGAWQAPHLQPERTPYASPSEARYAVLRSATAAGWMFGEVLKQARPGGAFAGLGLLLGTRTPSQRHAVLTRDWEAAARETQESRARHRDGRNSHMNSITHPPPTKPPGAHWPIPRALTDTPSLPVSAHRELTRWQTAVWLAERDPVRCKGWGRRAVSTRLVLRALALAVRLSGEITTAFGCRSLALMSGLSWRTVATVLAELRAEHDPLVDLVHRGRDLDADCYMLRTPHTYRAETTRTVLQAGRIESGHPVWLADELGPVCALLYETLSTLDARPIELQRRAVLSASAVTDALAALGAYGLAVRGPDGWHRGGRALDDAAAELGAFDLYRERIATYRAHRADWRTFLESVRPLELALTDLAALEAAFAEHDRLIPEHHLAPDPSPDVDLIDAWTATGSEPSSADVETPGMSTGSPPAPNPRRQVREQCPPPTPAVVPAPAPAPDDTPARAPAVAQARRPAQPASQTPLDPQPTPVPPPAHEIITPRRDAHENAAHRGASLARRLLAARTDAEREQILTDAAAGPDP
ncbi:hypothetical protein [Actinomadura terrae]|uniref:hypothetical protein n=1 Tax=Actinomadura terrae TaxID=604353 RepID=UPI001FA808EF|nr:hypothetical protein [Actinomadura terrae]